MVLPATGSAAPEPADNAVRAIFICTLAALVVRLSAWSVAGKNAPWGDERAQLADAWDLVAHGQQHVFWPPVTGWISAALFALIGYNVSAARLLWIGLDCFNIVVFYVLCRRLFDSRIAFWTSLVCALYPLAVVRSVYVTSEVPATLFAQVGLLMFLMAVSAFTAYRTCDTPIEPALSDQTDHSRSTQFATDPLGKRCEGKLSIGNGVMFLLAGAAFALSALSRGAMLALLPLFAAATLLPAVCPGTLAARLRKAAALSLGGLLVLLPWTLRNYVTGGQWVIVCTNSSYNMKLSTDRSGGQAEDAQFLIRPRATRAQRAARRTFLAAAPPSEPHDVGVSTASSPAASNAPPAPATTPAEEFARHDEARSLATARIREDLGGYLLGIVGRFARCWALDTEVRNLFGRENTGGIFRPGPILAIAASNAFFVSGAVLGVLGLLSLRRQRSAIFVLAVIYMLGPIVIYAWIHGKPRYHLAAMPLLFAFAVWVAAHVGEVRGTMTRRRLVALACTVAFFVWTWSTWAIFCVTSRGDV